MVNKEIVKISNLKDYNTYIEDNTTSSKQFFNITYQPDVFKSGRNLIKLKVNPDVMKIGSTIQLEMVDSNGDGIYYEIPDISDESGAVYVVFYIYDTTPSGKATLTIVGESTKDATNRPMPSDWQGEPNVKWTRNITITPDVRNSDEIIFNPSKVPTITINELVRPYVTRTYPNGQYVTASTGTVSYSLIGGKPTLTANGITFDKDMVGGKLVIPTPNTIIPTTDENTNSTEYVTPIKKVLSDTQILLENQYTQSIFNKNYAFTPTNFGTSNYEIRYEDSPTYLLTENSRSFAFVNINNIEPITGEVDRIKTFMKSNGSVGTWELVDDTVLRENELREILIDQTSNDVKTRLGVINNQTDVDSYWTATHYNLSQTSQGTASLIYNSGDVLPKSFEVDVNTFNSNSDSIKLTTIGDRGNFTKTFDEKGQYELSIDLLGTPNSIMGDDVFVEFFMSGSAFKNTIESNNLFGKKIGEIHLNSQLREDNKLINFESDKLGTGILVVKINSGKWYFGDVSIQPTISDGFNPSQTALLIGLPTEQVNDQINFRFEYYNYENKQSKYTSECNNCEFVGGNTYIGGSFNMLTGSLYVANAVGGGVEIQGLQGGMVRSIGYTGFDNATNNTGQSGFAIWSGSVLPNSGEDYNGVGLELHAGGDSGSLKFRTYPDSVFEVKTRSFFFGDLNTQYISGSNGNMEISSSGFYLNAQGDVTASSFLAVTDGQTMLDTNSGYADGKNIGRHIWHLPYDIPSRLTAQGTAPDPTGIRITSGTTLIDEAYNYFKEGENFMVFGGAYYDVSNNANYIRFTLNIGRLNDVPSFLTPTYDPDFTFGPYNIFDSIDRGKPFLIQIDLSSVYNNLNFRKNAPHRIRISVDTDGTGVNLFNLMAESGRTLGGAL